MSKKITRFFLVAILLCGCILTFAQDDASTQAPRNAIHITYGLVHSRLIDDGYSRNLLFRGTNSKIGLGYSRETTKYLFHFSVEASGGKIKSKSGDLPSEFYTVQPSVDYMRNIGNRLLIGVGLSSTNYFIINEPVFDNASLVSLHGIYLNVSKRLTIDDRQRVQLTYRLPAAVYVNRLLWNGGASDLTYRDQEHLIRALTTNGSFDYMNVFRNVQFNADYSKRIGKKTDLIVGYRFRYFGDRAEPSVRIYSNELQVGLKISF